MLPVLVDFKIFKLYTFGIFLVLAFFWSVFLLWRNIRLTSYKEEDVFDGLFTTLASALLFGRLVYVSLNFDQFGFDILKFILINGYPGLSLFGMVIGGLIGLYLFLLSKKIRLFDLVDYFVSPLLLAIGIGKIGSFFAGTEIGVKTKFFLAIKYAGQDGFRHLTALYEGTLFLIGAFLAHKLMYEIRRGKYDKGFTFYFFFWYLGFVYFLFDRLKENHLTLVTKDSVNFTISLAFLLTFSFYFLYYFRHSITKRILNVTSFLTHHGQKVIRNAHQKSAKKASRGEGETNPSNTGTQEE
jgi:phosphatidylglycerol---prolipoprotein diacylglyceryl transferase